MGSIPIAGAKNKPPRKKWFIFIRSEGLARNQRAKRVVWNSSLRDGMASRAGVYLPSD